MANSKNARNKKEKFTILDTIQGSISNIMKDPIQLAIIIAIIVLICVAIYLFITQKNHKGLMGSFSDTSPMAPLTNTPTN
jgi:hypothetical protein